MDAKRLGRVAEESRRLLSSIIASELRDPRLGFLTITRVVLSSDLEHAMVHVSVLGDEVEQQETIAILTRASRLLRWHLRRGLGIRTTPELQFRLDVSIAEGARVLKLMDDVKAMDEADKPSNSGEEARN